MSEIHAYATPARRNWRNTLFPQQPFPACPEQGFTLRTTTIVYLGWQDRLRILVSGLCILKLQSITDVEVRKAESESTFAVLPPGGSGKAFLAQL